MINECFFYRASAYRNTLYKTKVSERSGFFIHLLIIYVYALQPKVPKHMFNA